MNRKLHVITLCFCAIAQLLWSQEESFTGIPQATTHTYIQYNQFLFNPATSFNQEAAYYNDTNGYFSFFGKLEKIGFEDGPSNFGGTYTKTFNEHMSFGVALLQQSIGIFSNFGGVLNYAYSVDIKKDVSLAFGTNVRFQSSSITGINSFEPIDNGQSLNSFENATLLRGSLGANLKYKNFDFGVAGRNLLNTALAGDPAIFDTPTIVVHTMLAKPIRRRSDNIVGGMLYLEKIINGTTIYGLNGIIKNKKYGFAQIGYNQVFGVSLGLGFNVAPFATIGYTIERGIGDTGSFGSSHEIVLAYNITQPRRKAKKRKKQPQKPARELPEREELSKAEQLIALKKAREEQQDKLAALQDAREKATLLRNQKLLEEEQKAADEQLLATIEEQLDGNDINGARANLDRILNSQYIDDETKKAINSRFTRVAGLQNDIEEENLRIAEETRAKNETRSALQRFNQLIAEGNEREARALLERINISKYATVEEKAALSASLDKLTYELEAEAEVVEVEAKNRRADSELLRVSITLLDDGNLAQAETNAKLIRESKFLTREEKKAFLSRLVQLNEETQEREADKISLLANVDRLLVAGTSLSDLEIQSELIKSTTLLNDDEKRSTLERISTQITAKRNEEKLAFLEKAETKIVNGDPVELQAQASLIRNSKLLSDTEKQSILSRITRTLEDKQRSSNDFFAISETAIAAADVEGLEKQSELIRTSSLLSDAQKQALLERVITKQSENKDRQDVFEKEIEESLVVANLDDLEKKSSLIRASSFIPAERKGSLLDRITSVSNYRKTVDEISNVATQDDKLEEASLEELRRQSLLVRTASFLKEPQKKAILQKISSFIENKEEEIKIAQEEGDEKKLSKLLRSTTLTKTQEDLIVEAINQAQVSITNTDDVSELRAQKDFLNDQDLIPQEEKQALLEEIDDKINDIEGERLRLEEAARLAEEQRKAEEAARLAEIANQKAALIAGVDNLIANGSIEDLEGQKSLLENNTFLADSEKQDLNNKIDNEIDRRNKETLRTAEEARQREEAIAAAENVIATGTIEELQRQSTLLRSSTLIPADEKESLLEKLNSSIANKEAEEARIAEETRLAEEARIAEETRLAEEAKQREEEIAAVENSLDEGDVEALKRQSTLLRSSTLIPEAEKQSLLERITTTIANKEVEEARITEETRQREEAITEAENVIATGTIEELQRQSTLLRSSTLIPADEKESLIEKLNSSIANKEAEEARIAEEKRLAEEARIAEETRLAEEAKQREEEIAAVENTIDAGDIEALQRQATLLRSSTLIPAPQKQALLQRLTNTIQREEEIAVIESTIDAGDVEALQRRATLLRSSTIIPAEQKRDLLERVENTIETKEAEVVKKREEEIAVVENTLDDGDVEALKRQSTLLRSSTIIPTAQKQALLQRITTTIENKEAEKRAEEARLALEAEQKAVAINKAEGVIASGSIDQQRSAIEDIQANDLLSASKKQELVNALESSIASKEAEEARIVEEKRLAEEARIAEEKRLAEEARIAEEKRLAAIERERQQVLSETQNILSSGTLQDLKKQRNVLNNDKNLDNDQKRDLLVQIDAEIGYKEAEIKREEEARKRAEDARLDQLRREEEERRRVEEARIAEQRRVAEAAAKKAEEARLAEEARIAEEARLEQERLARKKNSSLSRSTTVVEQEEKRKSAELKRVSKVLQDEKEKEERRKAVQAELKRTTKVIKSNDGTNGSGARLKRTIKIDPNKQGNIDRKPRNILELQREFFEKELHLNPKLELTKIPFVQLVNALVNSDEVSDLIEETKTIDLNKKNRKVLKTKLKSIRTSENQ